MELALTVGWEGVAVDDDDLKDGWHTRTHIYIHTCTQTRLELELSLATTLTVTVTMTGLGPQDWDRLGLELRLGCRVGGCSQTRMTAQTNLGDCQTKPDRTKLDP